jgi:hypothetical protein
MHPGALFDVAHARWSITALATATLRLGGSSASAPPIVDIGIRATASAIASTSRETPAASAPKTRIVRSARGRSATSIAPGASSAATMRNPWRSRSMARSRGHAVDRAHGTSNTRPIATRTVLRRSGSLECGESSTPEAPKLAAFRKIAPMLSVCTIPSHAAIVPPAPASDSAAGSGRRRAIAIAPPCRS